MKESGDTEQVMSRIAGAKGPRFGVRGMFFVGGVAIALAGIFQKSTPLPWWLNVVWGVVLALAGLVPPRPPRKVNRLVACLAAAASAGMLTAQAHGVGEGIASAEAGFVILFPLLFMVVVPDDPWVTAAAGLTSVVGVVGVLGPASVGVVSPDRADAQVVTTVLVAMVAMFGTVFHGWERAQELRIEKQRSAMLEDLAVRERLVGQAEQAAQVGRLAADVGHEINNPLSYVVTNLELAQGRLADGDAEHLAELLRDALDGAQRIELIVRDLKMAARDDEDDQGADVDRVIESALRMANNELRHRTQVEIQLGYVPRVATPEGRLIQVVVNLLVNAAHAIPERSYESGRVRVVSGPTPEGKVFLEVSDNGVGMSPQTLARVFEPFYTTKAAGTGLGLPICKKFVEARGGTLTIDSRLGEGTTVRLELPVHQPREEGSTVPAKPPSAPRAEEKIDVNEENTEAPLSLRILLIDDEPLVARAMSRLLRSEHEVTTVASAAEALERIEGAESLPFDLVLCDLMMPNMSGMELYEHMQSTSPELAERFVFMTGGAFSEESRKFLEEVSNPVVDKPVRKATLRELIAEHGQRFR